MDSLEMMIFAWSACLMVLKQDFELDSLDECLPRRTSAYTAKRWVGDLSVVMTERGLPNKGANLKNAENPDCKSIIAHTCW